MTVKILKIILVPDDRPPKAEIARFSIGFRLNFILRRSTTALEVYAVDLLRSCLVD